MMLSAFRCSSQTSRPKKHFGWLFMLTLSVLMIPTRASGTRSLSALALQTIERTIEKCLKHANEKDSKLSGLIRSLEKSKICLTAMKHALPKLLSSQSMKTIEGHQKLLSFCLRKTLCPGNSEAHEAAPAAHRSPPTSPAPASDDDDDSDWSSNTATTITDIFRDAIPYKGGQALRSILKNHEPNHADDESVCSDYTQSASEFPRKTRYFEAREDFSVKMDPEFTYPGHEQFLKRGSTTNGYRSGIMVYPLSPGKQYKIRPDPDYHRWWVLSYYNGSAKKPGFKKIGYISNKSEGKLRLFHQKVAFRFDRPEL